jgi:hypothetical protein
MNSPYLIDILFMNDNPKRGGARIGAGAPKKPGTIVRSYRCYPHEETAIKAAIKKEIARLRVNY